MNNKGRYEPIRNAQAHAEIEWQTRECLLTWHTCGLLSPVADFNAFPSTARSNLGDVMAVGDCQGGVRLYRSPCVSKNGRFRFYPGHSAGVSKVCFSYEDRHLLSAGAKDQCIFVWQHLIVPGPEETDALIGEMIKRRGRREPSDASPSQASQHELELVPPYLSKIVTPTTWNAEEARLCTPVKPDFTMEYVHGFRGNDRNQCVRSLDDNRILYLAAMVLVIMDVRTRVQRFFRKHEHDVTCFVLHPGRDFVASADSGQSGKVLIWNNTTLQVMASVATVPRQSPFALCFSCDGSLLFGIIDDKANTVVAMEWESSKRAAIEMNGIQQVLAIAAHPDGKVIVSCGLKHIKFWTLEKGHLIPINGSFGAGKPQTLICIEFSEQTEGVRALTLTGAQNGCIYMWREHRLDRIIVAHRSPILDMQMTDDGVLTCGVDGLVRLWSYDWTSCARVDVAELTRGLETYSPGAITPIQSVTLLYETDENNDKRRIVIGMESNEVFLLGFNGHPEDVDVLPETQLLVQGHTVRQAVGQATGGVSQVCAHPTQQVFATIGRDKTLRTWDCNHFSPMVLTRLPAMGTALAYFPDGNSFAAGLSNGAVLRIDCESGQIQDTIFERKNRMVTRIKFSPSGKLLAVGFQLGQVVVLDVGAVCVQIFTCVAVGCVDQLDFSTDEKVLQCSTMSMDLSFFSLDGPTPGKQITRAVEYRDKAWDTWTSRFGFPVQGLSPSSIACIKKAKGPILVAALTSGKFTTYPYPAIAKPEDRKAFHAHLLPLGDICLTADDQRLISVGMCDGTIVQWRVSMTVEAVDGEEDVVDSKSNVGIEKSRNVFFFLDWIFDEWEANKEDLFCKKLAEFTGLKRDAIHILEVLPGSVILKVEISALRVNKVILNLVTDHKNPVGRLRKDLNVCHLITDEDIFWSAYRPQSNSNYLIGRVPEIETSSDLSQNPDLMKPYVMTAFEPNVKVEEEKLQEKLQIPSECLELEHVHGFAGFKRTGNLFYVGTGEALYTVAGVAVVHDTISGRQCFFQKHVDEIVAVTVHKDGELVATADNGIISNIYVWSSVTMETLMRLNPQAGARVVSMCFSRDSSKLIVVTETVEAMVEIFDW